MSEALETDDRLSRAEVALELERISPADWIRLERLAQWAFAEVSAMSHEDLLQEACVKLLSGERVWRRGFATVPAITSVMRSMASNYRKRQANGPIDAGTVVAADDVMNDSDSLVRNVDPVETITPEAVASDAQQVKQLVTLLDDDAEAALIAYEWVAGRRGKEAADALGMNENQYEAARKRLLRKLETMKDERRIG
ncbi:sigma-70 family RNA polymerase sigma factor [Burkholderia vietnamiensis]|uniref:sigma-70 family RNA polymerase sigma factor n=1 Tax=Burkholderia vietnamiensis TaxID=60552 RepID=UPI00158DBB02|nr:sigma-70 family RNA polymerase sigma factor [Burkholderia vietnamiensis]MBR8087606.1 sigma-70 family RNA polymerase sigma factor [Burkholderia vietnamiensis]MCA8232305.1 hypothetical protein [Burkholderia vietnamiensis]MDN7820835.1 sigma-70 family RNA polymerase sigma factor [Burkholderia vietnamiensis]